MADLKTDSVELDIAGGVRPLNAMLHDGDGAGAPRALHVRGSMGRHNVAVGARWPLAIEIHGHVGYYAGAMNQAASVTIHGNAAKGLAENIMSGCVRVDGDASDAVGASGRGGLVVVRGNAASRCGISMKGVDIVIGGSIGHLGAFMAQAGTLVVCGDSGPALGDSLYEAVVYVGGTIDSLGADAQQEPMTDHDRARVAALLDRSGLTADVATFKRVGSARKLYHWNVGDDRIHG